jgi:hypothetical protein
VICCPANRDFRDADDKSERWKATQGKKVAFGVAFLACPTISQAPEQGSLVGDDVFARGKEVIRVGHGQ